ncbi:hypothetical protein DV738_g324, partial [Chaetothyriales sp. CBS 135597]
MQEAALTIATYLHRYRLLSPQQQHHLKQQQELLQLLLSDISTLRQNRARLSARILSQYGVLKDIGLAATVASGRTNISSAPELPDLVGSQLKHLQELQTQTLPRARYNATNAAVELLRAQAEDAEWLVRWLEQRRHGAEARIDRLEEEEDELDRRKGELSEALAEYDKHGISIAVMEQLGKRYAEIESEIDQVKADLDRLSLSRSSPQWL